MNVSAQTRLELLAKTKNQKANVLRNNLTSVLKILVFGSVISLSMLPLQLSYAQEQSFRSVNYPDRYIRHRGFLGYVEVINVNDKLGRNDATFRRVPGLAGKCNSFESINYPGFFLRHQDFRLKLMKQTNEQLFKEDATFCVGGGLGRVGSSSFQSVNFPGYFIRHSNFELWLVKSDGSTTFNKDASFDEVPPLSTHSPQPPSQIDPGTVLNPVDE